MQNLNLEFQQVMKAESDKIKVNNNKKSLSKLISGQVESVVFQNSYTTRYFLPFLHV